MMKKGRIFMKKFLMTICFLLVMCAGISGYTTSAKAADYTMTLAKDHRMIWSDGQQQIYLNKARTRLNCKDLETGEVKLLKKLKATDEIYYTIANVYEDKIYLNKAKDISGWDLYVYDMTQNTFRRLKKDCHIQNAQGKYLLTAPYTPTDISPYPTYVYEITGNGIKKLKALGKNTAGAQFMDGRIYYASYPNIGKADCSGMNVMKVYSCKLDGSGRKLVFTRKTPDPEGYMVMQEVENGKITFAQYDDGYSEVVFYEFDLGSKKITKSKVQ